MESSDGGGLSLSEFRFRLESPFWVWTICFVLESPFWVLTIFTTKLTSSVGGVVFVELSLYLSLELLIGEWLPCRWVYVFVLLDPSQMVVFLFVSLEKQPTKGHMSRGQGLPEQRMPQEVSQQKLGGGGGFRKWMVGYVLAGVKAARASSFECSARVG